MGKDLSEYSIPVGEEGWWCRECQLTVPEKSVLYRCREPRCPCREYDLCHGCAKVAWGPSLEKGLVETVVELMGLDKAKDWIGQAGATHSGLGGNVGNVQMLEIPDIKEDGTLANPNESSNDGNVFKTRKVLKWGQGSKLPRSAVSKAIKTMEARRAADIRIKEAG